LPRDVVGAFELLALDDGAIRAVELLHAANQSHNVFMERRKWVNGTYVVNFSVVGTVERIWTGEWRAHGCIEDWRDQHLGHHATEEQAKTRVEEWARERDE
jgi:hypothetical protein